MNRSQRREADALCRPTQKAAAALRLRYTAELIGVLCDLTVLSAYAPWASQRTLAAEVRCCPRTIARQTQALEAVGLLIVTRSTPTHDGHGRWTRQTNRYTLCTKRAARIEQAHRPKPHVTPTGHACPQTFNPAGLSLEALVVEAMHGRIGTAEVAPPVRQTRQKPPDRVCVIDGTEYRWTKEGWSE